MTLERLQRIRGVLAHRQPDLTVLMENVHKPHNLSAILRSCDAVGVLEAHAVTIDGELPTYSATSASADKWVKFHLHKNTEAAIRHLQSRGIVVAAAHLSDTAKDYQELDYTQPTCILLGAEKWGVSETAARLADHHIIIPMRGMVQSLNVSVAAAVILFEAARQRSRAGFYDAPRLNKTQLANTEREWWGEHKVKPEDAE